MDGGGKIKKEGERLTTHQCLLCVLLVYTVRATGVHYVVLLCVFLCVAVFVPVLHCVFLCVAMCVSLC